jgi:uncharacterized membrane protein YfcA
MSAADPVHAALLVLVGIAAGVVSTVVSLASLVSYPALLAVGLPPVAANVTNTVALVFTSLGAAAGSRRELAGQARRILVIGPVTAVGGGLGAVVLLHTPAGAFAALVPLLIAGASTVILLQPRWSLRRQIADGQTSGRLWGLGILAAAGYIGYFGAAGGVLMLASLAGALRDELIRLNALKNVVSGLANGVAAVGFAVYGPVRWDAAVPLAAGFLVGGRIGPVIARRFSSDRLRRLIATSGFVVAAALAVRAFA